MAALLAWIIGANILTSAMGTIVGNPWTFPFIWIVIYHVGCWLLGIPTTDDLLTQIKITLDQYSLLEIINSPLDTLGPFLQTTLLPMFVGGLLVGSIVWMIIYWPLEKLVREYKHQRVIRRIDAARRRREREQNAS